MYCITVADGKSYVKISKSSFEDMLNQYRCAGYKIDHVLEVIDKDELCSVVYFACKQGQANKEIGYLCCKY